MKYLYTAVFSPIEDGSGFYARVPDLSGCITTGKTIPDAIDLILDAASLWLCTAEDEGLHIPEPTQQASIDIPKDGIFSLLQIDTFSYRAATDTRAVRKNVSLPQWMARLADLRGLNCSQILQDALRTQLEK